MKFRLTENGRIFSTKIRSFKFWKMPKLLNLRFPEGWYFLNCENTEMKRSSTINVSVYERHRWAVGGLTLCKLEYDLWTFKTAQKILEHFHKLWLWCIALDIKNGIWSRAMRVDTLVTSDLFQINARKNSIFCYLLIWFYTHCHPILYQQCGKSFITKESIFHESIREPGSFKS